MGRKKSNYDQGAVMSSVRGGFEKGTEGRGIIVDDLGKGSQISGLFFDVVIRAEELTCSKV